MSGPVFTHHPLVDIGHGVAAALQLCDGEPEVVEYAHTCNGARRSDRIPLKPAWSTGWTLESREPLTVSPSLLCTSCNHHGFIRDGRWVPA